MILSFLYLCPKLGYSISALLHSAGAWKLTAHFNIIDLTSA